MNKMGNKCVSRSKREFSMSDDEDEDELTEPNENGVCEFFIGFLKFKCFKRSVNLMKS